MKLKVKNMISDKGNFIPNQFIIKIKDSYYFQSYETIICKSDYYGTKITLDKGALNYSRTTSKYLYKFLGLNRKEIEQRIKNKTIKLKNLN